MEETQAQLIGEQLSRLADQLNHRITLLEQSLDSARELQAEKIDHLKGALDELKRESADHEARLRSAQDSLVGLRVWSSLLNGGSGIAALAALARSFLP